MPCRSLPRLLVVPAVLLAVAPTSAAQNDPGPCRLILPAELQAVPGVELNVYFDNICLMLNPAEYTFDVTCAKGRHQSERWTFIPTEKDVGSFPLSINVRDAANRIVASATTNVRVVPPTAGGGRDYSCLIIGDSLTHASHYPEAILKRFAADEHASIRLIGTHHVQGFSEGNRHEGYGGWTAARFATLFTKTPDPQNPRRQVSPFVFEENGKPTLDFKRYLDEHNGGRAPDFIVVALGCNDTFSAQDDTIEAAIDKMFGYLDQLIAQFHGVRRYTEIGLVILVPPAASQDAFGANYRCGQTRWQYRRNQHRVDERLLATYGGRENEHLFLIPANVNLDTVHNYPARSAPVNAHSDTKVTRLANGVHPARSGYYQMGDSIYCWIKGLLPE